MPGENTTKTLQLAREWKRTGYLARAGALIEAAVRAEPLSPADRVACLLELSDIRTREGQWPQADIVVNDAFAQLDAIDDGSAEEELRLQLRERKAWLRFRQGRLDEAREIVELLIRYATDRDDRSLPLLARLHNTLAGIEWNAGRIDAAIAHAQRALEHFHNSADLAGIAHAHTNLGILHFTRGDWPAAAEAFTRADALHEEIDDAGARAANLVNIALLQMSMGNLVVAREQLEDAIRVSRDRGERSTTSHGALALAHVDLLESRIDEARAHLDAALQHGLDRSDDEIIQANWLESLVECVGGNIDRAVALAAEARAKAQAAKIVESEADACRTLGVAHVHGGHLDEAEGFLRESLELAELTGDPYRRGLAFLELANLYAQHPHDDWRRPRASRHADRAVAVFQTLGASRDLARARAVSAQLSA